MYAEVRRNFVGQRVEELGRGAGEGNNKHRLALTKVGVAQPAIELATTQIIVGLSGAWCIYAYLP